MNQTRSVNLGGLVGAHRFANALGGQTDGRRWAKVYFDVCNHLAYSSFLHVPSTVTLDHRVFVFQIGRPCGQNHFPCCYSYPDQVDLVPADSF
jgi:hypothetical protein